MAYAKTSPDERPPGSAKYPDASQNESHRGHEFYAGGGGGEHLTNYAQDGEKENDRDEVRYNGPSREPGGYDGIHRQRFGRDTPSDAYSGACAHRQGYSGYVGGDRIDEGPGGDHVSEHKGHSGQHDGRIWGKRNERQGRSHFDPDYHQFRTEQIRDLDRDYDEYRQERYRKFAGDFDRWRSGRGSQGKTPNADSSMQADESGGQPASAHAGAATVAVK